MNRMRPWRIRALMLCLAVLMSAPLVGCDDGNDKDKDTTSGDTDMTTTPDGDTTPDGGDTPTETDGGPCQTLSNPTGDADNDGIENRNEDRDQDCVVDEGETDWNNPDTDGDTILDGDEDINGNGIVDNGEFDPRKSDSDDNGVPDNEESKQSVCKKEFLSDVTVYNTNSAEALVALEAPLNTYAVTQFAGGAVFSKASDNVFGFIVQTSRVADAARPEAGRVIGAFSSALGKVPTPEVVQEFETWEYDDPNGDQRDVEQRPAVRHRLKLDYGAASQDPALIRDQIAQAIVSLDNPGTTVTSGQTGTACSEISMSQVTILWHGGSDLVVAGVLSCSSDLEANEALRFLFEDISNGTMVAPIGYDTEGLECAQFDAQEGGGVVDYIWVVDNSGSLEDEQGNVAVTAQQFIETLSASPIDWRLAVTTTEVHGLDPNESANIPDFDATHDELLNTCSGFRGVGFLQAEDADAASLFSEYVTFDEGCNRSDINPPPPIGSNVCGSGLESGLKSGLFVIEKGLTQDCDANHQLRPDADRRVIVFVSDEEDQTMKSNINDPDSIIAADDPTRLANNELFANAYIGHNTVACAIVGDQGGTPPAGGTAGGGACTPLQNTTGAQYGLGYEALAIATGGTTGSICNPNLQTTIEFCIRLGFDTVSDYTLPTWPISPSITVSIDYGDGAGPQILERSQSQGWNYNPDSNSLIFFGPVLQQGAVISVSYQEWDPKDT